MFRDLTIPFQVFIPRIGASALEAPRNYCPVQFVVLECFNHLVRKFVLIFETCTIVVLDFYHHVFIVSLLRFLNKSGRGRPGLSRGECHSGWPFCTCLGLATGLVGRLPSRLLWYLRRGGPAGCLTWIGQLPHYRCGWIRFRIHTHT